MSIIIKILYPNKNDLVAFDLGALKVSVGRNEDNDISLRDSMLSGNHITIGNLAGRVFIQDLKSSNGTIINSTPVAKRTRVYLLDEVVIGEGFYISLDRTAMTDKELIANKRPHENSQPLDIYTKEVCDINIDERYGEVKIMRNDIDEEILLDFKGLSQKTPVTIYKIQYDEEE